MHQNHTHIQTDTRTAAQATARPDLYAGTYWGNFRVNGNAEMVAPAIIANRNRFVEEWRIKTRSHAILPRPTVMGKEDFDHIELYRDEAGLLVLVCSNYGDDIPPPPILGMQKIPALYCEGATSYAARYSLTEARARLEAVGGGPKFGAARHLFGEPPTPRRSRLQGRGKVTA